MTYCWGVNAVLTRTQHTPGTVALLVYKLGNVHRDNTCGMSALFCSQILTLQLLSTKTKEMQELETRLIIFYTTQTKIRIVIWSNTTCYMIT